LERFRAPTISEIPSRAFAELFELAITNGTGANQANNAFSDERTLNASASENLDLAGVLQNALGASLAFTAVKAILIVADVGNVNNVVVGGAGPMPSRCSATPPTRSRSSREARS
jgi:hypothetical protein